MLTLFEDYTYELTPEERDRIIPLMVKKLLLNVGANMVVNNTKILRGLERKGFKTPRIRKYIHYITVNKLIPCLVANSKGYYVATDPEEVRKHIRSLEDRIRAMKVRVNSLKEQLAEMKPSTWTCGCGVPNSNDRTDCFNCHNPRKDD